MPGRQHTHISPFALFGASRVSWLLLLLPVSWLLHWTHASELWLFFVSTLAILPLAYAIGWTVEQIAEVVGTTTGGLLNATFGNMPELVIGLFALHAGLTEVVKASISGGILANLLLILGLSMVVGGVGREKQTFSRVRTGSRAAMLFLAVVALVMPAVFDLSVFGTLRESGATVERLSLFVAIVLLVTYAAGLLFSFTTGRAGSPLAGPVAHPEQPHLGLGSAFLLLGIATVLTAVQSDLLVGALDSAAASLHMSHFFIGVVIVSIVGSGAESVAAVTMARKDQMDFTVTIATSASIQLALLVAPLLVFFSFALGHPLSLVFNALEVVGLALAVIILMAIVLDGESNWLEGVQLMAVYAILAIVFYFVPVR